MLRVNKTTRSRRQLRKKQTGHLGQQQGGFTTGRAWMTNSSFKHMRNTKQNVHHKQQKQNKQKQIPKFKKVTPTNKLRFQLWNNQQYTWHTKLLQQKPILLKKRDIINWQHFRTQKLNFSQLYLWNATSTEWVPLWSLESGFLLINSNFIRFTDVSLNQFTNTQWIKLNSVEPKYVKQLLAISNITMEQFADVAILPKKQNISSFQTIAGSPFLAKNPRPQSGPPIYRPDMRYWNSFCIFNKHDQRFCYDFIHYFHILYHQSSDGVGRSKVVNFKQAAIHKKTSSPFTPPNQRSELSSEIAIFCGYFPFFLKFADILRNMAKKGQSCFGLLQT